MLQDRTNIVLSPSRSIVNCMLLAGQFVLMLQGLLANTMPATMHNDIHIETSWSFTCMGHISIMAHLMVPSFLLLCGCVCLWQCTRRVKTAFMASS